MVCGRRRSQGGVIFLIPTPEDNDEAKQIIRKEAGGFFNYSGVFFLVCQKQEQDPLGVALSSILGHAASG